MATYVYVVKEVRSSGEENDPVPDYDGAGVRQGRQAVALQLDMNTSYAVLLFGSYNRPFQAKSRMLVDLASDRTWMKLDEIYCGGRGWTAKFLEKKFGTDHKKLFLMIAPTTFNNMIQGGTETDCYSTSQTMVRRTDLERWIHAMSYPGGR